MKAGIANNPSNPMNIKAIGPKTHNKIIKKIAVHINPNLIIVLSIYFVVKIGDLLIMVD